VLGIVAAPTGQSYPVMVIVPQRSS